MKRPPQRAKEVSDEPPPFLRTWPRLYTAVLCYLFFLIVALYVLTRIFRY